MCRSMNSLMSMRTMAFSSSNSTSARALQSSVLPTPVGPRKMNEPIGRLGSCRPLRLRRTALATASTASSWPTTRWWRPSSSTSSFARSVSIIRATGMPVQALTTSAISSRADFLAAAAACSGWCASRSPSASSSAWICCCNCRRRESSSYSRW